jgi:DNA-binding response OmpR family regulator
MALVMQSPDTRILLVEDHSDTRELFEVFLAQSKYEVETASTINEALQIAGANSFGLFIFDAVLPDGSGVDLCRSVRQFDERTPILFCSGLAYEADIKNALGAGAQAYLVKPVDLADLTESVEQLIGKCAERQSSTKTPDRRTRS